MTMKTKLSAAQLRVLRAMGEGAIYHGHINEWRTVKPRICVKNATMKCLLVSDMIESEWGKATITPAGRNYLEEHKDE
jgi:hypothetical protein